MGQPVYVVTTFDPRSQATETAGGFTELSQAKQCALDTVEAIGEPHKAFIEEWHGGTFHAHRELRVVEPDAAYQWFVSQGPAFAPIEEAPTP